MKLLEILLGVYEPTRPKYDGKRYDIGKHGCPDCGGDRFYEGPSGGTCTNIKCASPECGSEFNVGPFNYCARLGANATDVPE